jgi:nicotinamidase-related amidase
MAGMAVVVIDVQQAFFSGPQAAYRSADVIEGINRLTAAARAARVPVFFVQHDGQPGDPDVEPNTPGWQLAAALARGEHDVVVPKTACDAFHKTLLANYLDQFAIDRVFVCGFATQYCVDTTVRRAASLGYPTTIVGDLHTTRDHERLSARQIIEHHSEIWENLDMPGNPLTIRPLADILATEFA